MRVFTYFLLVLVALWVFLAGATSDVIDVDAAQYAAISMEMVQTGSYLQVFERGHDYLDKPPLLFWVNAGSFTLFGLNNFSYKLPTLLFSLIALGYTFLLGKRLYGKQTAWKAVCILVTCIGFVWANNDVKTDAMMTSCILVSVYHLLRFYDDQKIGDLLFGSFMIGLGLMTKGPMGLIFPAAFLFFYVWVGTPNRKISMSPAWLLLPVVVLITISPMLWGLYQQFDLQPHKVVHGKTGVSGLRFFFWEQSFGRITGENYWRNDTSFFYLFHVLLLLMLPFSLLLVTAVFNKLKMAFRQKTAGDLFLLLGTVSILFALSLSSYKIPHYGIVLLPYLALLVGHELEMRFQQGMPVWLFWHNALVGGLIFLIGAVCLGLFDFPVLQLVPFLLLLLLQFMYLRRKHAFLTLVIPALALALVFNTYLLPHAQHYSQGRQGAALVKEKLEAGDEVYFFNRTSNAIEFYSAKRIRVLSGKEVTNQLEQNAKAWYYMSEDGRSALLDLGFEIAKEHRLLQYDLNRISIHFLNPATRAQSLEPRYLIQFR